jgi:hypothetical protein
LFGNAMHCSLLTCWSLFLTPPAKTALRSEHRHMSKQESSKFFLQGNVEKKKVRESHYYVQSLPERVFLVRRCLSGEGKPGSDDRIVRSFDIRHDASSYADSLNDGQQAR